jgi:DNA-binding response OmpR family regulator
MDRAIRSPKPPGSERLLVVDDEKDTADVMKMALERAGFSVDVFYNPVAALQGFKAGQYNLVVIDIKMPEMDGFTLCDRLRAVDPELRVCFMTARSEDELLKLRLQNKSRVCVAKKPIHVRDLVLLLRAELDVRKEANAA